MISAVDSSCILKQFNNPQISDILPGLKLHARGFELQESAFVCCGGEGMVVSEDTTKRCSLSNRRSYLLSVLRDFSKVTGQPCHSILDNVDLKVISLASQLFSQSRKYGLTFDSHLKTSHSIWAAAAMAAWRFGLNATTYVIDGRYSLNPESSAFFVLGTKKSWGPAQVEELDWIIGQAYNQDKPLWISFHGVPEMADKKGAKSAFSRRLRQKKSPLSGLSHSSLQKLREVSSGNLLQPKQKSQKSSKTKNSSLGLPW